MCLTKLLTSNNEMKTLQSNHVPPCTNNLVWLRGNAASSHPCKSSGSSYEEFPIPDGLVRSSRPTTIFVRAGRLSLANLVLQLYLRILPYGGRDSTVPLYLVLVKVLLLTYNKCPCTVSRNRLVQMFVKTLYGSTYPCLGGTEGRVSQPRLRGSGRYEVPPRHRYRSATYP